MGSVAKGKEGLFEEDPDSLESTEELDRDEIRRKVSQRLMEALQQRNAARQSSGSAVKPPKRRGRKPKEVSEFNPEGREEDSYVLESEFERIEYDTGIKVGQAGGADNYDFERFEKFEEELNFDEG